MISLSISTVVILLSLLFFLSFLVPVMATWLEWTSIQPDYHPSECKYFVPKSFDWKWTCFFHQRRYWYLHFKILICYWLLMPGTKSCNFSAWILPYRYHRCLAAVFPLLLDLACDFFADVQVIEKLLVLLFLL